MLSKDDRERVIRHAPILRFDRNEPFLPSKVGVEVFRRPEPSPSFPRIVDVPDNASYTVEYAIWWDWDIQHLYELEHVWVSVDEEDNVVGVEGSWHGTYRRFPMWEEVEGHPVLYSQPGKHAIAFDPREFPIYDTVEACTHKAGSMGLLVKEMFVHELPHKRRSIDQRVREYLKEKAFKPTFEFEKIYAFPEDAFMNWHELKEYIPQRVRQILRELRNQRRSHRWFLT
ncbi:MAG: hypothetical protein DRG33_03255 [Deltaproteobacteria bacterium]|nr:MAG: hypothetical protein DRG33_03255 [Deltaproteobacteria bacterium]